MTNESHQPTQDDKPAEFDYRALSDRIYREYEQSELGRRAVEFMVSPAYIAINSLADPYLLDSERRFYSRAEIPMQFDIQSAKKTQ